MAVDAPIGRRPSPVSGYPGRGLHGSVVESLGQRIVGGEVAQGDALPIESALAKEADVSRTVVREALRVLASKGLVDARPMRGTRVRERHHWRLLDPDVLRWSLESDGRAALLSDLLDVRYMIEPEAARLAALRSNEHDLSRIQAAWTGLAAAAGDPVDFIEADLALHSAILEGTHNLLVSEFVAAIGTALRLGRAVQATAVRGRKPKPEASVPVHDEVVQAIAARDAEGAEWAMRRVIDGARRDAERVIGSATEQIA